MSSSGDEAASAELPTSWAGSFREAAFMSYDQLGPAVSDSLMLF